MKTITIVGGGSGTHVLIPLLSETNVKINLLTSKPDKWVNNPTLEYVLPDQSVKTVYRGRIDKISNNPSEVIPDADIIILCMPVHQYRNALHTIASSINRGKEVFVGTIYGQAGFNWMAEEIQKEFNLDSLGWFAIGLIPWISRVREYGESGITYGCKSKNVIAVYPFDKFDYLNQLFLDDLCHKWFGVGEFVQADNFISLTLSVDNQIIHPSRMQALTIEYGDYWNRIEDIPYFYRDYSKLSGELLKSLDQDYSKIRETIYKNYPNKKFTYMLNYLDLEHFSNGSKSIDIVDSFVNSQTLTLIKTPVIEENGKWKLNNKHRFFLDDIFYGVLIAKWFAKELDIKVDNIDKIIRWAEKILSLEIMDEDDNFSSSILENKFFCGIPSIYGIKTIDQAID
jgi:hypothetical protein